MYLSTLHDLARDPFNCPSLLSPLNQSGFDALYYHLRKHKMSAFTFHLTACKKCKKKFTPTQIKKLESFRKNRFIISKLLMPETAKVTHLFKKNKIKAILPKDFSWLKVYRDTSLYQSSTDIDLIVSEGDFTKTSKALELSGWKFERKFEEYLRFSGYRWQDLNFSKKNKSYVTIDLQYSVGRTKKFLDKLTHSRELKNVISDLMRKINRFGIIKPVKEIQLMLAVIHFYFYDDMIGIRQAFEVKEIARELNKLQWKNTIKMVKRYKISKVFFLVLLILEKFFNQKIIPDTYANQISKANFIFSRFYPFLHSQNLLVKVNTGLKNKTKKLLLDTLRYAVTAE